ncbi:zeatin O-glucosyltransferase-like [Humulus lupulus]|uniref:zeatin O-glucosyltransferase-like n=1 Tax=Humulus lupulus TaxID=3486 RepID=UPI002B40D374|nr:zeatin O-glucosyltransferase-like [Humulus lupulus]
MVQDFVSLPNAEAYAVNCGSVFSMFTYAFAAIGQYDIIPIKNIPSVESCYTHQFYEFIKPNYVLKGEKKIWVVGPLHQTTVFKEARDDDKCLLEWLDKQEPNSVLYISFGTTTTFSEEKIKEIALGLEQGGVKFMWVLRDEDRLDSFSNGYEGELSKLPSGFEESDKRVLGSVINAKVIQIVKMSESGTKLGRICGLLGSPRSPQAVIQNKEMGEQSDPEKVTEDHQLSEKSPPVVNEQPVRVPYPQRLRKTTLDK